MTTVGTVAGLLLPIAAVGVIASLQTATAASPSYCALYAREYAVDSVQPNAAPGLLQSVQDQAYYRCLNQDEDPPLPKKSAYFGTDVDANKAIASTDSATDPVPIPNVRPKPPADIKPKQPDDRSIASAAVFPPPPPPPAPPKPAVDRTIASGSTYSASYHGSGMKPWTPEWIAWCARNFPASWDPKTGTILNYGADRRELCR